MMEAFIITPREGVEAALVVYLILAAAEAVGRTDLKRPIFLGVGVVLLASFLGASLLRREAVNEEPFPPCAILRLASL